MTAFRYVAVWALALTSCNADPGKTVADNAAVPRAAPTAAATIAPAAASLSRFVGKYPSDAVGGTTFLADPLVGAAVRGATTDADVRGFVLGGKGPETPIAAKDGKVVAWGCEQHNCGDHNWTLLVAPDGSAGEVCVFDGAKGGATWYADDKATRRGGECPPQS